MRHQKEAHLTGYVAVQLVLTCSSTHGKQEKDIPWKSHFKKHLEVEDAKHARVEFSSHEEVIDRVTSHAVLGSTIPSRKVCDERNQKARANGYTQQRSEFIDDGIQFEKAAEM